MVAAKSDRQDPSFEDFGDSFIDSIGKHLRRTTEFNRVEGRDAPAAGFDTGYHVVMLDVVGGLEDRLGCAGGTLFPGGGLVIGHRKDRGFGRIDIRQFLRELKVGGEWIVFGHESSPFAAGCETKVAV